MQGVFYILVFFCIEELTYEWRRDVTSYVLAEGVKLDFGFGPQYLTSLM